MREGQNSGSCLMSEAFLSGLPTGARSLLSHSGGCDDLNKNFTQVGL